MEPPHWEAVYLNYHLWSVNLRALLLTHPKTQHQPLMTLEFGSKSLVCAAGTPEELIWRREMFERPQEKLLTSDFYYTILCLHHQLFRCKVVDIQCHFPAIWSLPDLRDSTAQLAVESPVVGRVGPWWADNGSSGHRLWTWADQRSYITWPAGGGPCRPLVPVLRNQWHPKRLVQEPAASVPVPAGAA